jgi:hypothetical protein
LAITITYSSVLTTSASDVVTSGAGERSDFGKVPTQPPSRRRKPRKRMELLNRINLRLIARGGLEFSVTLAQNK